MKFVNESRELTADQLNTVSGGKGPLSGHDKDLQTQEQLGIQTLVSNYIQASALACSILKTENDTILAVIGNIKG